MLVADACLAILQPWSKTLVFGAGFGICIELGTCLAFPKVVRAWKLILQFCPESGQGLCVRLWNEIGNRQIGAFFGQCRA